MKNKNTICSCEASIYNENMLRLKKFIKNEQNFNNNELINLIQIYCETLLFFKRNSSGPCNVKIKGKIYYSVFIFKINGKINALDIVSSYEFFIDKIINQLSIRLSENLNIQDFEKLITLTNSILETKDISHTEKLKIIKVEHKNFSTIWDKLLRFIPESISLSSLNIRENLILETLKEPQEYYQEEYLQEFVKSLNLIYISYILFYIKVQIANNHIIDIFQTLYDKLAQIETLKDFIYIDLNVIVNNLLKVLIINNTLFQFQKKEEIQEIIQEYKLYIKDEEIENLKKMIDFDIDKYNIENELSMFSYHPKFIDTLINKKDEMKTRISFLIPFKLNTEYVEFIIDDCKFEFLLLTNLYSDPAYFYLDEENSIFGGIPATIISDAIGNVNNSSIVYITFNKFEALDFTIENNEIVARNFEIESAKRGGKYYPFKDIIIENLYKAFNTLPFQLEKKNITSDLISNFKVECLNNNNKSIYFRHYFLTNQDSFIKLKNRFFTKVNSLYLNDDFTKIKELLMNSEILNNKNFLDFCYKLLELTIKKSIEFSGLHKALWDGNDNTPVKESKAQAIIYNQIKDIAEIKGIRVSREVFASDGSVDFHFHYTKDNSSLNICIELKNAHHDNIEHGIKSQLPLYIKDVGHKEGIYLVLWYKTNEFNQPNRFNTINELEQYLLQNIPKNFNIKPLIIDCTNKASPSTKDSADRLSSL